MLYDTWLNRGVKPRRADIEEVLTASYREAWRLGDSTERDLVLHFIMIRREEGAVDVILEALRSNDEHLARTAAIAVSVMILQEVDFGPSIRSDLLALNARFPSIADFGEAALRDLDRMQRE